MGPLLISGASSSRAPALFLGERREGILLRMALAPASDASPASWFVDADELWYVKGTYGPPGLAAYARVSLVRDEDGAYYPADDLSIFAAVLDVLAAHTTVPHRLHVGVWDGWGAATVEGPHFSIPGRDYVLLTGDTADVLDPTSYGLGPEDIGIPHLVWPHDQAWFVCWDTDEDRRFTVGGSARAMAELSSRSGVTAQTVAYGTPEPGWSW
jgi:hypothetical protein